MDIVHRLQKVAKVATRRLQHFVVTEIGEETHKAFAEKVHEIIERLAGHGGQRLGQVGHQIIRVDLRNVGFYYRHHVCEVKSSLRYCKYIYLMRVEDSVITSGRPECFFPYVVAELFLGSRILRT